MLDVRRPWGSTPAPTRTREETRYEQPDLLDWLRSGRLTLVDENKQAVPADRWPELPSNVRARALADFRRVVRGNTKAAVIFLQP